MPSVVTSHPLWTGWFSLVGAEGLEPPTFAL
jgi:hypothetical protein